MKDFDELITEIDEPEVTDEEAEIRAEVFLNGYQTAEDLQRKKINNISFQLNKRFLQGCQAKELIWFYNERIGGILDDFIF